MLLTYFSCLARHLTNNAVRASVIIVAKKYSSKRPGTVIAIRDTSPIG